jgi:hypothetical protein
MSTDELSLFSYEILGLVGRTGAGAHDLRRMAQQGRILDWAGESQYYVEPKRLARLGYLEARREPGKTRERTIYTLTDKGLEALRDYARTPVRFTPLKSEPLLRLLIADLVGEEPTRESIATCGRTSPTCSRDSPKPRRTPKPCPTGGSTFCSSPASSAGCSTCTWSSWTRSSASSRRNDDASRPGP